MSKKKSKNARLRAATAPSIEMGAHAARPDWDTVEAEFFARESELYLVGPVDTFDDLDD